jgi:hypothetical protein
MKTTDSIGQHHFNMCVSFLYIQNDTTVSTRRRKHPLLVMDAFGTARTPGFPQLAHDRSRELRAIAVCERDPLDEMLAGRTRTHERDGRRHQGVLLSEIFSEIIFTLYKFPEGATPPRAGTLISSNFCPYSRGHIIVGHHNVNLLILI